MVQAWFELESDPGLFTLLVEDFGIKGVQVEEIYDLDTVADMGSEPLGFIFLFRWIEDRRRRRKLMNENHLSVRSEGVLQRMFFAHQVIPNSCATHALLSILLNCKDESVKLTKELTNLKTSTKGLNPDQKGNAIGSLPRIADAHNSHASPHLKVQQENKSTVPGASQTGEAYHYVSYLPIDGHLYEMDGLKPWPLDHGKYESDWTKKFSDVITERLGGGDIMFNLMAVVPDRRLKCRQKLDTLKQNWIVLQNELKQMMKTWKDSIPDPMMSTLPTNSAMTVKEWIELVYVEHAYPLPVVIKPQSPKKSPVKSQTDSDSVTCQVEELIGTLSDLEESYVTEVVVHQQNDASSSLVQLQEFSEFNPCRLTRISVGCNGGRGSEPPSNTFTLPELLEMLMDMKSHVSDTEQLLKEQEDLRDKYKIDVCRRTHNYYPFITTFLRMLAEQGLLNDMANQLVQPKKKNTAAPPAPTTQHAGRPRKRLIAESKAKAKTKIKRRKK